MRILVTGVTGQIGRALRAPLMSLGEVIAADRTIMDLSKPELVPQVLNAIRPNVIVNPAAYTAVDQAEDEPDLAFRVNAIAPQAMAEWAARCEVPIIHFSTDYVFDGSGYQPWSEGDPTGPLSIYGASKLAGENAVRGAGGDHLIVRTAWVFAAQGRSFLTTIVRLARERRELRIVADQIGAPTSADTIARGVMAILTSGRNEAQDIRRRFRSVDGLIHLCASDETSWYGFAQTIVDGVRRRGETLAVQEITPVESKDCPTRAKRPQNSRLDLSRLQVVLGIKMPDWRKGVDEEIHRLCAMAKKC